MGASFRQFCEVCSRSNTKLIGGSYGEHPLLQNEINATDAFPTIRASQDPIVLLKLIQSLCCSYDAKTQSVMATVASHKKLFTYYQKDGINNHKYYQEFCAHVETLETYGGIGAIGITPLFLANKLSELAKAGTISSATSPTDDERMQAILLVRDEFLGCLMLSGANRDRTPPSRRISTINMVLARIYTQNHRTNACRY